MNESLRIERRRQAIEIERSAVARKVQAIHLEDDKLISSVPGIGKKTAQKIIVDLKGSIDFSKKSWTDGKMHTSDTTLISSLVQMGYDKARVESVIEDINPSLNLEQKTVEAIRNLAKN